jgi:hypothetical protein
MTRGRLATACVLFGGDSGPGSSNIIQGWRPARHRGRRSLPAVYCRP